MEKGKCAVDQNCGVFVKGKAFDEADYIEIMGQHRQVVEREGGCSVCRFVSVAAIIFHGITSLS